MIVDVLRRDDIICDNIGEFGQTVSAIENSSSSALRREVGCFVGFFEDLSQGVASPGDAASIVFSTWVLFRLTWRSAKTEALALCCAQSSFFVPETCY